jgi:hypothetical protein
MSSSSSLLSESDNSGLITSSAAVLTESVHLLFLFHFLYVFTYQQLHLFSDGGKFFFLQFSNVLW